MLFQFNGIRVPFVTNFNYWIDIALLPPNCSDGVHFSEYTLRYWKWIDFNRLWWLNTLKNWNQAFRGSASSYQNLWSHTVIHIAHPSSFLCRSFLSLQFHFAHFWNNYYCLLLNTSVSCASSSATRIVLRFMEWLWIDVVLFIQR